jgi:hypothetical protein
MVSINDSTIGIIRVPWQEAVKRLIDLVGSSNCLIGDADALLIDNPCVFFNGESAPWSHERYHNLS